MTAQIAEILLLDGVPAHMLTCPPLCPWAIPGCAKCLKTRRGATAARPFPLLAGGAT